MSHKPAWHARITGATRGSGFLIDERHVLTCAHVVGDRSEVTVSFLALGRDHAAPGTVVFCGPWQRGSSEGDLAVVRLDEPVTVVPARLAPLHAVDVYAGQELAAFGFPSGYLETGQIAYFTAEPDPRLAGHACQTDATDGTGFVLTEGYSGSAAYVKGSYDVVGMVISADRAGPGGSRSGVILPMDEIHRQWPEIAERIALGPFGPVPYRELRDILRGVHLPDAHVMGRALWTGPDPLPARPLPSLLAVAEALAVLPTSGEDGIRDLVVRLLREVGKRVPGRRAALHEWSGRHGWGAGPSPADGPAAEVAVRQAWIVVRVATTGAPRRRAHRLTIWTASGPEGDLDEPVLDDVEVSRAKVRTAVQQALPRAYARIPHGCETIGVEFVLPRGLLGWDVESWVAEGDTAPLGWKGPVVVRDLDWFNSTTPHEIVRRANRLREDPRTLDAIVRWLECSAAVPQPDKFRAWLWQDDTPVAVGLTGVWAAERHVHEAVATGVPALLWRRGSCERHTVPAEGCPATRFCRDMAERLHGLRSDQLPRTIRALRAESGLNDDPGHCGRDVTLLWDEPKRRPAPLGFAE
ncbi:trypsin-like peptidase domain-containing protein [Micromonospora sp. NPDC049203]|uniref:VMAP-C domain-containing protein n=1 Tax=Micromonospora sp. NPDC049203 TaxID=3364267 RepID=UPI00372220CA